MRRCLYLTFRYMISFWAPKRRTEIAREICGWNPLCLPGDMIAAIRKANGFKAMLLADVVLFGGCAAVCALSDGLPDFRRFFGNVPGMLACMAAFCLCEEYPSRAFLKYAFIVFSYGCGGHWTLTTMILIVFEHLAAGAEWTQGEVNP